MLKNAVEILVVGHYSSELKKINIFKYFSNKLFAKDELKKKK